MGSDYKNIHNAKKKKNDEFFTRYEDIEAEIAYYKHHLEGKILLFNCNDTEESNFWKYFYNNFHKLKLKKIIGIGYGLGSIAAEYNGRDIRRTPQTYFFGNEAGDFRSFHSVRYLQEADIVITNPPFSLFRDYVNQLIHFNKKFLIIGHMVAINYKDMFYYFQQGLMWYGVHKRIAFFNEKNGSKKRFGNISWYTNLEHGHTPPPLKLTAKYDPDKYDRYDYYDEAINVDRVTDIPKDYLGEMGVPLSFILKWNPHQFKLLGLMKSPAGGKQRFMRIIIKRTEGK